MSHLKSRCVAALLLTVAASGARGDGIRDGSWRWSNWPAGSGAAGPTWSQADPGATSGFTTVGTWTPGSAPVDASAPVFSGTPATATPPPGLSSTSIAPAPASSSVPDAFLNFGGGPYPNASDLLTGQPQPWYDSPAVTHLYGGIPNAQQQTAFANLVLQDVQKTYQLSGLSPNLTLDPNAGAAHTLSVVSGASYGPNPDVIGITEVGRNGFSLIDKFGQATSVDQLAWVVAHNISHELMHAFGVAEHPDTTGTYIDAASASWAMLTDPNQRLSPAAVAAITAVGYQGGGDGSTAGLQVISPSPVPEPATWAVWAIAAAGLACRARSSRRLAA